MQHDDVSKTSILIVSDYRCDVNRNNLAGCVECHQ